MKILRGTEAEIGAMRTRIDGEKGYPKQATEADRQGGGIHVPLEMCRTETSFAIDVAEDGSATAWIKETQVELLKPTEAESLEDPPLAQLVKDGPGLEAERKAAEATTPV